MRDAVLVSLVRGEVDAAELMRQGELEIEGRVDLFTSLAACFTGAKNWLSVRM